MEEEQLENSTKTYKKNHIVIINVYKKQMTKKEEFENALNMVVRKIREKLMDPRIIIAGDINF